MKRAALCCPERMADYVYAMGRRARLAEVCDLKAGVFDEAHFDARLAELADVEAIFATWNMPKITEARLDAMPNLKAIFYAAGSVRTFATPVLQRGITLMSAWRMNAIPVAEFTIAQILLSTKGYFANSDAYISPATRSKVPSGLGNFEQTVSLLGAGAIGRLVIEMLRPFRLHVAVFDPYLSAEEAEKLGVRKVSLEQAFTDGVVVSNHLANVPATVGLLLGSHFRSMQRGATFINTGRGAQVRETEMIAVLRERRDLYALLDVTDPEPPVADSPLWSLPNVRLSSHIAGSLGNEVVRMADLAIEEFQRWENGQPLEHQVTLEMLDRMA